MFFSLPKNRKITKIWKNRINHTDLPKIIAFCKQHLGESCFNKSADLGRRLMKIKKINLQMKQTLINCEG